MRPISTALFVLIFAFPVSLSYGQTMDGQMEKHMKEHMGDTMDKPAEKKAGQISKGFTQEAEAAAVTVKVTFKNPEEKRSPVFAIVMDTHTVDLDQYKLDGLAALRDDSGREYSAALISSSGSGHHREATVEFKDVDISSVKYLELVIKGVGGVAERVFKFEISGKKNGK